MISVSVSDLDSFRRYRDREEMTLAELMKKLKREEPPTEKMLAGSALHSVLETTRADSLTVAEADGYRFLFLLEGEIVLPPIREMRGQKEYQVTLPGGGRVETVNVRARVDSIDGTRITDHKLTSSFDAERYIDSYQWRFYLSIFGGQQFVYNVFVGKQLGVDEDGGDAEAGSWEITEFHPLAFFRYPEMEADILRELSLYAEFALNHLEKAA